MPEPRYSIAADPSDSNMIIVTDANGSRIRIHREDADPEHRFTTYRLAAGWFGNLPAGFEL